MNKRLFLATAALIMSAIQALAQNVGIGTNTPNASAGLDISSNTKGLLIPRMTTTQRTAIVNPAQGLMVYDTETSGFWFYNGSIWKNVAVPQPSNFNLPYAQSLNTSQYCLDILNYGSGEVLYVNNAGSGTGISVSTSAGMGVRSSSNGNFGLYASSWTSVPVYGLITNVQNSLASIRAENSGGGVGLQATSTNNHAVLGTSSAPNRAGIRGESSGNAGFGVYGFSSSATGVGVQGTNTSGTGVQGTSNTSYGVQGITYTSNSSLAAVLGNNSGTAGSGVLGIANFASGNGVQGSSTTGTGVFGYSNDFRSVAGSTINGTALYGNSISGYALESVGKVKISGGNTNPSLGAVLTSDAIGNAVWKPKGIAFKAVNVHTAYLSLPNQTYKKVYWGTEQYDFGNNFNILVSGSPTSSHSNFIVPVSGVYHFDIHLEVVGPQYIDVDDAVIALKRSSGGFTSTLAEANGTLRVTDSYYDYLKIVLSTDFQLTANDQVWVEVLQRSGYTCNIIQSATLDQFSCSLVFAN